MSNATLTGSMRAAGWNVVFTRGRGARPVAFAGIHQVVGSELVTFRDVCNELRPCFAIPNDVAHSQSGDNNNDPWACVAFSLPKLAAVLALFCDANTPGPACAESPTTSPQETERHKGTSRDFPHGAKPPALRQSALRPPLRFIPRCSFTRSHIPDPVCRQDPRYLPPNETPSNPNLTITQFCQKLETDSRYTSRRSSLDADLPGKDNLTEANDREFENVSGCLSFETCCVVSGEGESWCPGQPVGPGVQACHIIPQQHYHLYPNPHCGGSDDDKIVEGSPRRLREAWQTAWSPSNGILLMKHLHGFFNARLFSIHPDTFRIRVFVPYNALTRFNGRKASVPESVDCEALRHHYEMCCIENMAAARYFGYHLV
ncbi:hypothetical protein O1611_g4820 [Lasiodiplodia mahajangana]|uniref:Uncharacterized protein n=1 Tax=Lasiodiplodia mahajangana TaxID=1108764 RepID=A0ACC2JMS4_9PEZI|nr:hypothetical protein O1611_g4820 [Lasiodiplodia mahajangana]